MVVQVTPPGVANLGWRFWVIWAVICFSFIPITYFFYPETANRTLEDIDRFFETDPGIIVAFNKSKSLFSLFPCLFSLYKSLNGLISLQPLLNSLVQKSILLWTSRSLKGWKKAATSSSRVQQTRKLTKFEEGCCPITEEPLNKYFGLIWHQ